MMVYRVHACGVAASGPREMLTCAVSPALCHASWSCVPLQADRCQRCCAGPLGASDDLPVQPAEAMPSTIDLKDLAQLSQQAGTPSVQSEGESATSRSGFTIPVPRSEDSQGTNRSSMDFRWAAHMPVTRCCTCGGACAPCARHDNAN